MTAYRAGSVKAGSNVSMNRSVSKTVWCAHIAIVEETTPRDVSTTSSQVSTFRQNRRLSRLALSSSFSANRRSTSTASPEPSPGPVPVISSAITPSIFALRDPR
jgi:hypothetical protein